VCKTFAMTEEGRRRSNENLKRGQQRFKGGERRKALERKEQWTAVVMEDPTIAIRSMFTEAAKASLRLYRKLNRTGARDVELIRISVMCDDGRAPAGPWHIAGSYPRPHRGANGCLEREAYTRVRHPLGGEPGAKDPDQPLPRDPRAME
jgi:hypothetical protein